MAHFMPCVDVPEDGFDDFEFAKYLAVSRQSKRSKTLPNTLAKRISSLVGKDLSTCSIETDTTCPEYGHTEGTCEEIRNLRTGDDYSEIQQTDTACDYDEIRSILTGGEADGWYPVASPVPSLLPAATLSLRTVPFSTQFLPLPSSGPAIVHVASMCQISTLSSGYAITPGGTLSSGYAATSTPMGTTGEATKQTETTKAGDRPPAPASGRRTLSLADALMEGPEKKIKEETQEAAGKTTLMLCQLPNHYSRNSVMDLLRSEGLADHVTFIYVPSNLRSRDNFGYAFVDFDSASATAECKERLEGFTSWSEPSEKVLSVGWSDTQGLDANIERYRNSPLMHESVDDELKPAIFGNGGHRVAFPKPTKHIRAPRLRRSSEQSSQSRDVRSMTV